MIPVTLKYLLPSGNCLDEGKDGGTGGRLAGVSKDGRRGGDVRGGDQVGAAGDAERGMSERSNISPIPHKGPYLNDVRNGRGRGVPQIGRSKGGCVNSIL